MDWAKGGQLQAPVRLRAPLGKLSNDFDEPHDIVV